MFYSLYKYFEIWCLIIIYLLYKFCYNYWVAVFIQSQRCKVLFIRRNAIRALFTSLSENITTSHKTKKLGTLYHNNITIFFSFCMLTVWHKTRLRLNWKYTVLLGPIRSFCINYDCCYWNIKNVVERSISVGLFYFFTSFAFLRSALKKLTEKIRVDVLKSMWSMSNVRRRWNAL